MIVMGKFFILILLIAFIIGVIFPAHIMDIYQIQNKYVEQADAGFKAGQDYTSSTKDCDKDKLTCNNLARQGACSSNIGPYLSICRR